MIDYRKLLQDVEVKNAFNVRDDLKSFDVGYIKNLQPKFNYAIACFNVTGSLNVGNMVRSAVLFGADKVFILGRQKYDKRSTVGAENYIDIDTQNFMLDEVNIDYKSAIDMIAETYTPVFIEYHKKSVKFNDYMNDSYVAKPCFIFGNEGMGIPEEILETTEYPIVKINQYGVMRSLNVAVAAGIVMSKYTDWLHHE